MSVFFVSIVKYHVLSATDLRPYVDNANVSVSKIYAERGKIYESGGNLVAGDADAYNIICYLDESRVSGNGENRYVDNPLYVSQVLASILDMDEQTIFGLLTQDLYQTELGIKGRNLPIEVVDQ
ncbi:MAG: penicillin-binding protein, partial [Erysipelotrichaceae bacterium]|nr:penicillin-binding protein [Erysipelotrichaceae bacterium]